MNKTTQSVESATGAFHIEDVFPSIDGGRFPVKRIIGEPVEVWADIYRDGHEVIAAALVWRREVDREWRREPMTMDSNDRWSGTFVPDAPGRYVYAIEAWTDEFATWRHGFELKQKAGADQEVDAIEGAGLLGKAQSGSPDAAALIRKYCEDYLQTGDTAPLLASDLKAAMAESQLRPDLTRSQLFPFVADRPQARFSTWYEMVPRSQSKIPGQHGTFSDCIARLPDVAAMGFDVLYFTPIHPIGKINRKGRNNAVTASEGQDHLAPLTAVGPDLRRAIMRHNRRPHEDLVCGIHLESGEVRGSRPQGPALAPPAHAPSRRPQLGASTAAAAHRRPRTQRRLIGAAGKCVLPTTWPPSRDHRDKRRERRNADVLAPAPHRAARRARGRPGRPHRGRPRAGPDALRRGRSARRPSAPPRSSSRSSNSSAR